MMTTPPPPDERPTKLLSELSIRELEAKVLKLRRDLRKAHAEARVKHLAWQMALRTEGVDSGTLAMVDDESQKSQFVQEAIQWDLEATEVELRDKHEVAQRERDQRNQRTTLIVACIAAAAAVTAAVATAFQVWAQTHPPAPQPHQPVRLEVTCPSPPARPTGVPWLAQ